jgi:hypothetical protein
MSNGLEAKEQRLLHETLNGREEGKELFSFPNNHKAKMLKKCVCVYIYIYNLLKYEIGPEPKVGLPRTMHSFA